MNLIGSLVILTGFALLYTNCESGANEMAEMDAIANLATDRGGAAGRQKDMCQCLTNQYPVENLSEAEKNALIYMREEEKLARDVYNAMLDQWGAPVFSNIARAEQRHTDAILCLLNKYDLTDPAGANAPGVFQNTTLQTLYNTLIAEGKQNKIAALTVGAKIEDLDISDLEKALTDINNADIIAVFGELNRGSRNHLRAFVTNLETLGVHYVPAFISVKQFEEIIATPQEKGGSICGTCPNANNPVCTGNGNCNGPKGKNGCVGTGPNGNKACPGNGPKGNGGNGNGGN